MAQDEYGAENLTPTKECTGTDGDSSREGRRAAWNRADLYNHFIEMLGGQQEDDEANGCYPYNKLLDWNGGGRTKAFWDWDNDNRCKAIDYAYTSDSIYDPEGYKKCVCRRDIQYSFKADENCRQESTETSCEWSH